MLVLQWLVLAITRLGTHTPMWTWAPEMIVLDLDWDSLLLEAHLNNAPPTNHLSATTQLTNITTPDSSWSWCFNTIEFLQGINTPLTAQMHFCICLRVYILSLWMYTCTHAHTSNTQDLDYNVSFLHRKVPHIWQYVTYMCTIITRTRNTNTCIQYIPHP